ncbi:ParB/RepB/Spo0J family partition protein [Phytomonospora endophytica]|uniref:ParB family chromosome partitioning protein n=1 Tax=Phytomonospora endophytica TaxID=714109 RepID=A0A841FVI1_9ACTN|nr:ParB/RepB/Spo0J family partition protein [Phytomonospora endophytica]MBB6037738.1 ParB family chromosome partitioning protein [Phytomonospora endophytica]GIG67735.1 hypothetical protein Pen01_40300 [Phytomonospora endophytica]
MDILDIPPLQLLPSKTNPPDRSARNMTAFRDSIAEVGILQPLVVTATDEEGVYRIQIGHRRHTAAIELGLETVPCVVIDASGDAEYLVSLLVENKHRENLTVSEEAGAYHQLTLMDWEPEAIARVTAQPITHVKRSLALTKLPKPAQQAADDGVLPLDQVADLEEFKDDPELLAKVLDKASSGTWGFKHAISDAKKRRDRKAEADKLRAELTLAGVKIISRPKDYPWASRAADASSLRDSDGNPLDPQEVKSRPGFAAFIEHDGYKPAATIVCTDPEAWGYTRTRHTSYKSPAELAEAERAKKEHEAELQALTAAAEIRAEFVKSTYHSAKAVKGLFLTVLRDAVIDPDTINIGLSDYAQDILTSFAGGPILPAAEKAGSDKLSRMLVARWLTKNETRLAGGKAWTSNAHHVVAYLDQLASDGYTLSEAEANLRTELEAELIAAAATDEPSRDDTDDEDAESEAEDA